jgi:predicted O-methyltransferase YrrM
MLYLNYRLRARHKKGRGIHPPFAYRIIREVIYGVDPDIEGLGRIEQHRQDLLKMTGSIMVEDFGAGSRRGLDRERRICDLVKHTAISQKRGRLLARLVCHMKPSTMIELGTGAGLASLYLSLGNPAGQVVTCEGSGEIAVLARMGIEKLGIENIDIRTGLFTELLPGLLNHAGEESFVFIDGDHRGDSLISYFDRIVATGHRRMVVVLDDIHWSRSMYQAWRKIVRLSEISLSIELYNTGIVFLDETIQQDHFVVIF